MKRQTIILLSAFCMLTGIGSATDDLTKGFANPPSSARPWVFWFWINGNISREGITADLEAMKRVGIGGVLWMEVSGMAWAPDGGVSGHSPQWHDAFQWAVRECQRLGIEMDVTLDFGYGSGGPHITPELSMQQLVWSETEVAGGQTVALVLEKPRVEKKLSAWLRPGAAISPAVAQAIEQTDSYREAAVVAIPQPASPEARAYRFAQLNKKNGLHWTAPAAEPAGRPVPAEAVTPVEKVIDLTGRMDRDGRLQWDAPPGKWLVIRYGHASNFKMTRPCPQAAVGLECDRLSRAGIETHFDSFLGKIIAGAGQAAGGMLGYTHIDSWEAGGQNWTAAFPAEFQERRGYDLHPWLPVLTGRLVGGTELSERFLWDVRMTVSEMIRDNYVRRLRELVQPHGMKLSTEAYGHLCIDNLSYAGSGDMPISEFWAKGQDKFPTPGGYEPSTKAMASAAHTYGKPVIGAESFTSDRGWRDHPYLLKAMGDKAFCRGLNRVIFHLSAHQAYNNMIPGLTHRKWGEHIQRFNTWFDQSRVWMDYLARSQYLLQQGLFVADIAWCVGEGAPLGVNDMTPEVPAGYDYDLCSSEIVLQMKVRDGRLVLPSGMSYRYLVLPGTSRLTLPLARKIKELADGGARVIGGPRPVGSPSLTDYPQGDAEIERIAAALWDAKQIASGGNVSEAIRQDGLKPDFEGSGLLYLHRQTSEADLYFASHQSEQAQDIACTFRVAGKAPELWDPETGATWELPEFTQEDGRITVPLHFAPMQSWFIVFRKPSAGVDPIVRVTRDGQPLETRTARPARIEVLQARYGVLDDPKRTRDVRARVQAKVAAGVTRFRVSELAEGDDPAKGTVKMLVVDYTVGGQPCTVTGYDRETIVLNVPAVAPAPGVPEVDLARSEIWQSGTYVYQTASGRQWQQAVALPAPQEISTPWQVSFDSKWGGPTKPVTFDQLKDWSKHADPAIRYYSGTANYRTQFTLNFQLSTRNRFFLNLGQVEVMARVILNGQDCGTAWKPPYRVELTRAARAGQNELEIEVVNLWINRMIGDEQLPEDSNWKDFETLAEWPDWFKSGKPRPSGRYTFTTCKHYQKDSPLAPSGLLGPVTLQTAETVLVK